MRSASGVIPDLQAIEHIAAYSEAPAAGHSTCAPTNAI